MTLSLMPRLSAEAPRAIDGGTRMAKAQRAGPLVAAVVVVPFPGRSGPENPCPRSSLAGLSIGTLPASPQHHLGSVRRLVYNN
eukprot:CAMPEP_0206618358 /NCGR_PEP_ID=MMETSP0325_2-20121206/60201_1 /ASSEMBLY_ACC=CAM_ASM_000347 /TAXON_ID=2866 /ORGANISM="Crypthecodinium cohnii, Strain Seligo" /LENGTH=82 /DNA_ID=CAMNT_0054140553 /DNA_START=236 /DNA_END=484 /DNA_ORIENTATION=+